MHVKNIKIRVKLILFLNFWAVEEGRGGGGVFLLFSYLYVHLVAQRMLNHRGRIVCLWCSKKIKALVFEHSKH